MGCGLQNRSIQQIQRPCKQLLRSKYRYDIGANVRAQSPAPAGNAQGKITEREDDSLGRLSKDKVVNYGVRTRVTNTRRAAYMHPWGEIIHL